MKNLYIIQNVFKKLVLLLSLWYAVTCLTITVANYRLMWYTVVTKVIFNTCFSSIICYIHKFYLEGFLNCNFK
jgi:hypothetical protein